jgi:hypothetical protein
MAKEGATRSAGRTSGMLRVRPETHEKLRELAAGQPLVQYLEELAEQEYRRRKLQEFNDAYARLREDPARYAAYRAESEALEGTLLDGLDREDGVGIHDAKADTATW